MLETRLKPLLEVKDVCQSYLTGSGETGALVLDHVSLTLKEGEIVGLLGRSGSGKSSLLRIISGLAKPTAGEVTFRGEPIRGPFEEVAMVFQSAALFPWLSVLANVELGLRAKKVPEKEARSRALKAIDLIGLDGFESAFPKELSGGMRQRVGFARALVVNPQILLMDEPFSALDVLTAETLRTDLLDLWVEGRMPIKSILMVTHNIEEAVLMCNRIVVLSSNPGRISAEIQVSLPHPRNRLAPGIPPACRSHLCADDSTQGADISRPRRDLPWAWGRHGPAAGLDEHARRPHGDDCGAAVQGARRPAGARR